MNDIYFFLNNHFEIENSILIIGDTCNESEIIRDFITNTRLKKIIVYFLNETTDLEVEMIKMNGWQSNNCLDNFTTVTFLNSSNIEKVKEIYNYNTYALCAVFCKSNDIKWFISLTGITPEYICTSILEGYENQFFINNQRKEKIIKEYISGSDAFDLWQKYHNHAKHILIKTLRGWKMPQVLDWEKNSESNIELSIIFPVYNVSKYIRKCIETVTEWKADYVEFIFVNDGSTDSSHKIINSYAKNDLRIRLIDKENGGCASARQKGLECARGKYVGFVDPDDFVDSDMFREIFISAMVGNYDISYCGYNEYYENTGEIRPAEDYFNDIYTNGVFEQKIIWELIAFARVAIWRGIYRRDFLVKNNIGFYTDLKRFDDLPFKVETFANAQSVISTSKPMYYYRLERPGQDVSVTDDRLFVHFDIFKHINESVASKNIDLLTDYLQICKFQTHRYALGRIQEKYKEEYINRAKKDLLSTDFGKHTINRIKELLGNEAVIEYKKMIG